MKLSKKGAEFLALHEGFRSNAYLDPVGILTIGIGFTWRSTAFRGWWARNRTGQFNIRSTMTLEEAQDVLQLLVEEEYGKAVNKFLGHEVPQHVYDGMCSAVFNLGPGSLKWRWAAACKAGNFKDAAAKLRVTGTTAGGKKLAGLVRRRKEEALLIEAGIYTGVKHQKPPFSEPEKPKDAPFLLPADYETPKQEPPPRGFWTLFKRMFGF